MSSASYKREQMRQGKRACPRCHEFFQARNWKRHVKACKGKRSKHQ